MRGTQYRLCLININRRQAWATRNECVYQRVGLDQLGPAGVDDEGVAFHARQVGRLDQTTRLGIQAHVQGHDVAVGKKGFARRRSLEPIGLGRCHRSFTSPYPDLHAEGLAIAGDDVIRRLLQRFDALLREAIALDDASLLEAMRVAIATAGLAAAGPAPAEGEAWHGIIGECAAMLDLRKRIEKFAPADAPVLITGESGTGKERVACAIHEMSRRSKKPLVAENCAAIPETLLESVLFGHVKGAFTGAIKDHPGHFVSADGGTLFLDEIGDMKMPMQVKLLRALQEGEVRPVGGAKVKKVDVRVIAATNSNLEAAVKAGRFREDLYFRLNVLRLSLPPLRDRGFDAVLLARRFLRGSCEASGRPLRLSKAAEDAIAAFRWPGNVRQLQNEMQRIAALCEGPDVQVSDLSAEARG